MVESGKGKKEARVHLGKKFKRRERRQGGTQRGVVGKKWSAIEGGGDAPVLQKREKHCKRREGTKGSTPTITPQEKIQHARRGE